MTREEAIKVLKGILHLNYRNFWDEECDEAIDIAIEALSEDKTDRMTREEAIADIKYNIKPVVGGKSLDMAIEALQREEAEEKGWCHRIIPKNVEVVVRCKDCRHQEFYINDTESFHCRKSGVVNMHMDDGDGDFFCKYGERAEQTEVEENDGSNTCNNHSNNADADYKPSMRLIDANALKAKWYEINDIDETDRGARFVGYTEITRLIDDAPTVEVGRPHGEWLWRTDIPIGDGRTSAGYVCSNCGKDYWHGNVLDVCPNCGARMTPYKGGEDE